MPADAPSPSPGPAPQRLVIAARVELATLLPTLIATAQRDVRVMAHDLTVFDLGARAAVAAIETVLLRHRQARVRLLADDPRWFEAGAPRLKRLHRSFAHALQLRLAADEDPVGDDAVVLVDGGTLLRLERTAGGIGEIWIGAAPRAQPLLAAFERRWEAAAHDLGVSPLGL